ncbi:MULTISPECIES: WG repeat-containing protein [Niastella]|uniref:WG repeat-containing protein n=1 Tax=Niastella soli TaxID=2821487 RepID=A0ABS3YLF7_9BACT|nr:WG repeat-containing protein [Niastella soli]MBO9198696.1 WG repeat-containing protein [Niastella soli]
MKTVLSLLSTLIIQLSFGQTKTLYTIVQDGKVGYINNTGAVVIKPVFHNGTDFSEGLAAVRPNGRYGYINEQGKFVIQPEFDLAYGFNNGLALVYKNGQSYFIDKTGKAALPAVYNEVRPINPRKAILTTQSKKQGLIDMVTKKLIIDTVFRSIHYTWSGILKAFNLPDNKYPDNINALLDTNGNYIVPFEKHYTINPFFEGYARVKTDSITEGVIDTTGQLVFTRQNANNAIIAGEFHNGYAKMRLRSTEKSYAGYINLKGEAVLNDPAVEEVTDFSNGRAFVRRQNQNYILVDRNFKQVGTNTYDKIPGFSFRNGYAIVEKNKEVGIIDTNGNYLVQPAYSEIDYVGIVDGYFFFKKYNDYNISGNRYGVANLKGSVVINPVIESFDKNGFINGIIKALVNDKLTYLNKKGNIIWQEKENTSRIIPLNLDYMNRGYFVTYLLPKHPTGNLNSDGTVSSLHFPNKQFSIIIDTLAIDTFAHHYAGYKLYLSNTTDDIIRFEAQDSRLYMDLQAQNEKGEWIDIEYLPGSKCGNSYRQVTLEPNTYWQFKIPKYQGEFSTKIRAALIYYDKTSPSEESVIYSNIINGKVNPAQFWFIRNIYPIDAMSPYYKL